jgi:hypothetical protein
VCLRWCQIQRPSIAKGASKASHSLG